MPDKGPLHKSGAILMGKCGIDQDGLNVAVMSDPKQTSERLQAIIADSERAARETQVLIDRTHEANEAYARLARALDNLDADLNENSPHTEGRGSKGRLRRTG